MKMEYEEGRLPETWKKFRQGKKPVEGAPLDIWVWYCPVIGEGTSSFVCSTCSLYKKREGCKYFDWEKAKEKSMATLSNGDMVKVSTISGEVSSGRPCTVGRFVGCDSKGWAVIEKEGDLSCWPYAAKVVEYTHRELVDMIGHDFIYKGVEVEE